MPFKSEKQRRYLWANEPEIARDWTDTYGSGIHKALGGRIPFQQGGRDVWNQYQLTPRGPFGGPFGYRGFTNEAFNNQDFSMANLIMGGDYLPGADLNKAYRLGMNQQMPKTYGEAETIPNEKYFGLDISRNYVPSGEAPLHMGPYEGERYSIGDMKNIGMFGSDQPEIFSETLQEGLDTSNIKQKQKRSREQELLDEMNQTKGTIKFDPNNVGIMKAGLIPDNFIEQLKSLWGGEPPTPEGIMKAGGYPFIDPADGNYISRDPRLAEYALSDDYENIDRFTETEDEPSKWNWGNVGEGIGTLFALANETLPWSWARRGWDALTSGFSGQRTPRDPNFGRGLSGNVSWAGQRYDKQYGTGAYKMKTLRDRYDRLKKSKSQSTWNAIQKEKVRKELAAKEAAYKKKSREAWQKDYSGWQSPSGRDHASTAGIGSRESKQGHSGSSHVGASRFR